MISSDKNLSCSEARRTTFISVFVLVSLFFECLRPYILRCKEGPLYPHSSPLRECLAHVESCYSYEWRRVFHLERRYLACAFLALSASFAINRTSVKVKTTGGWFSLVSVARVSIESSGSHVSSWIVSFFDLAWFAVSYERLACFGDGI